MSNASSLKDVNDGTGSTVGVGIGRDDMLRGLSVAWDYPGLKGD